MPNSVVGTFEKEQALTLGGYRTDSTVRKDVRSYTTDILHKPISTTFLVNLKPYWFSKGIKFFPGNCFSHQ
jgi:hypothetical protein